MNDEPIEAFDWHHLDLFDKSPYTHYDTVRLLAEGKFIIEGHVSNLDDANSYAHYHDKEPSVWQALQDLDKEPIYVY